VSGADDSGLHIGSVLDGRYRIDAVLGSGGMGRVYRGEHTGIGRAVAIKVLHADLNRNRDAAARFQREALASGRLDHPNIVGVSDFGVLDDGAAYLVMEALEGESLGELLQRDKRIPWLIAVEIMRGILNGLRHAHERGVVHRDIKPDNIFLAKKDRDLVVKILDFGIAKLYAGSADDPASTRAGLTVGTPAYLSPEQAVGGDITPASDIYSATVVLFEMLTGRAPFEDKDPLAMLGAHVSRTPPSIAEVAPEAAPELPAGIEELIQHGLVKTSADRIPSADAYLARLDAIAGGGRMPAIGSAPVHIPPTGFAPTATLTPAAGVPLSTLPTPPPGTLAPEVSGVGLTALLDSVGTGGLPKSVRAVSLAEAPAVPRRWYVIGAIVFGALVMIAILLAVVTKLTKSEPATPEPAATTKPKPAVAPPKPAPPPVPAPPPKPVETDGDRQTRVKAALYELVQGKDCAARRAAIPKLVELNDPSVISALRSARYRMRGGIFGIGDENTNACLTKDAEAAIKKLTPPK
jgi:serine/threonine-protein kinase